MEKLGVTYTNGLFLYETKYNKTPINYTKNIFNKYSCLSEQRVKTYIEENNIDDYIIFDDLNLSSYFDKNNFIHVSESDIGIRSKENFFD